MYHCFSDSCFEWFLFLLLSQTRSGRQYKAFSLCTFADLRLVQDRRKVAGHSHDFTSAAVSWRFFCNVHLVDSFAASLITLALSNVKCLAVCPSLQVSHNTRRIHSVLLLIYVCSRIYLQQPASRTQSCCPILIRDVVADCQGPPSTY